MLSEVSYVLSVESHWPIARRVYKIFEIIPVRPGNADKLYAAMPGAMVHENEILNDALLFLPKSVISTYTIQFNITVRQFDYRTMGYRPNSKDV